MLVHSYDLVAFCAEKEGKRVDGIRQWYFQVLNDVLDVDLFITLHLNRRIVRVNPEQS